MNTAFAALALAALLWTNTSQAGQPNPPPPQVMEGKLVDLVCHAMDMGGPKHAKCSTHCAEKGQPVGFVDAKTGKLYTVLLPSPGLAKYLDQEARLTAKVLKENFVAPDKLEMKSGETWTAVDLPKAM